jgi:hypothetical protein
MDDPGDRKAIFQFLIIYAVTPSQNRAGFLDLRQPSLQDLFPEFNM